MLQNRGSRVPPNQWCTPMCTPPKKIDTNLHPGQKKIAKETAVSILY